MSSRSNDPFDHPASHWEPDEVSGDPRGLGFNVVDADGFYLRTDEADGCQQILVTRSQAEWLLREGLPAVLKTMEEHR